MVTLKPNEGLPMKRFVMVMACALLFGAADAAWAKVAIAYEINGSAELIRNK